MNSPTDHLPRNSLWWTLCLLMILLGALTAFFAQPSRQAASPAGKILSMQYQRNPQPAYQVTAEVLSWKAQGEVKVQRMDYQPRQDGWWLVVDFGSVESAALGDLPGGDYVTAGRLPGGDSARLELRLASGAVRAVQDPQRPDALVLLDPSLYRQAWQRAREEESWQVGLSLLEEVKRLGGNQLGLPAQEVRQTRLEFLRQQGKKFFSHDSYRNAAALLSRSQEIEPDFNTGLLLAQAYLLDGKTERSREVLEQLQRSQPTRPEVLYYLGLGYLRENRYQQTIQQMEGALRAARINQSEDSLDPKLLCFLGTSYYGRYRYSEPSGNRQDLEAARSYLMLFLETTASQEEDRRVAAETLRQVEASLRQEARAETALSGPEGEAAPADPSLPDANEGGDSMHSSIQLRLPFDDLKRMQNKVVVVHFWATWCSPCLKELPSLSEFYRRVFPSFRQQGLELITVSNDFRSHDFLRFAQQHNLSFPIYFDPMMEVQESFGLDESMPRTLILGPEGRPVESIVGDAQWMSEAFQARLQFHLDSNGR